MLADLRLGPAYDGLIFLAESQRNPPAIQSHRHAELEVNLVDRGSITYVVGGRRHTFGAGTLLWFFPAQEHQLVDRSPDARYYVAVFKPGLIREACHLPEYRDLKRRNAAGRSVLSRRLAMEPFDLLRRVMGTLMAGGLDSDLLNREVGYGVHADFRYSHSDPDALNAGLRYLLVLCWRYYREGAESGGAVALHPAVQRAIALLDREGADQSLGEVARRSGVSGPYLSRLFRRQLGVPLNRYRNSVRLGRFMRHRGQPVQRTILESVYAAGFGSYAQFYKVFVRSFGHGPRRFLRRGATPEPCGRPEAARA